MYRSTFIWVVLLSLTEIISMELSDQEVRLVTRFAVHYIWKVNGELQPELSGDMLSLDDNQLDAMDEHNQTIEVEVTAYSQCGASTTKSLFIQRVPGKGESELDLSEICHLCYIFIHVYICIQQAIN